MFFPLIPNLPDSQECEKSQRKWQETPLEAALLTSPGHAIAAAENIALNPQDLQTKVAPSRSYQYDYRWLYHMIYNDIWSIFNDIHIIFNEYTISIYFKLYSMVLVSISSIHAYLFTNLFHAISEASHRCTAPGLCLKICNSCQLFNWGFTGLGTIDFPEKQLQSSQHMEKLDMDMLPDCTIKRVEESLVVSSTFFFDVDRWWGICVTTLPLQEFAHKKK